MRTRNPRLKTCDGLRRGNGQRGRLAVSAVVAVAAGVLIDATQAADEPKVPDAFEVCTSCHSYQRNEPALEGPPLWGVVGRATASVEGFEYSPALRALGGTWDRARLDRFLTNPKALVPGTKMKMGGLPEAAERGEVLDFLERLAPEKPAGDK
jgi:cytochrome c